jgi:hypothetical protein
MARKVGTSFSASATFRLLFNPPGRPLRLLATDATSMFSSFGKLIYKKGSSLRPPWVRSLNPTNSKKELAKRTKKKDNPPKIVQMS